MQITAQLLEVNLRFAREAHAQLLAQTNAKAGEVQALEKLLEIAKQPDPKPDPKPATAVQPPPRREK